MRAYIIWCGHAADKVFKNTEQKIGVQKLLNVTASEIVFTSPLVSTPWPIL